jgi:ferrous iron transport protein A
MAKGDTDDGDRRCVRSLQGKKPRLSAGQSLRNAAKDQQNLLRKIFLTRTPPARRSQMRSILKYDVRQFCSTPAGSRRRPLMPFMQSLAPAPLVSSALDRLELHVPALVHQVTPPPDMQDWEIWLAEIGFLPGERVRVIARGAPGGDPLVVRIGDSTFALRKAEAACVQVVPAQAGKEAA